VDIAAGVDEARPPLRADLAARARRMRDAEAARDASEVFGFARDVILLVGDVAADPRTPRGEKLLAGLGLLWLVTPRARVSAEPGLGLLEDLGVLGLAAMVARRLLGAAGYGVVRERWRGSDEGLALVLTLAGVQE